METRDLSFADYPERLRSMEKPPAHLTVAGVLDPDAKIILFAGAREASSESIDFAHGLAAACCEQGAIVLSGGAKGIDAAAHEGALSVPATGGTWAVLGTGKRHIYPAKHGPLYAQIAARSRCAVLWPFEHDRKGMAQNFLARNRYMVALADVVVVIEARIGSGSLHTAGLARKTGKELWVVPGKPWDSGFAGSLVELNNGARVVRSQAHFLSRVFPYATLLKPGKKKPIVKRSAEEAALLRAATNRPEHIDEICELAGLSPPSAATALLTLSLEHVLVEGPPGYYRKGETK